MGNFQQLNELKRFSLNIWVPLYTVSYGPWKQVTQRTACGKYFEGKCHAWGVLWHYSGSHSNSVKCDPLTCSPNDIASTTKQFLWQNAVTLAKRKKVASSPNNWLLNSISSPFTNIHPKSLPRYPRLFFLPKFVTDFPKLILSWGQRR